MPFTHRERRILRTACCGCRNEAYNHPEAADKAVVSDKCKLLQAVKYDRHERRFKCSYWVPSTPPATAPTPSTYA